MDVRQATGDRQAERGIRFGANYVPSAGWFYSWMDFSAADVRRDLTDLVELGLDHIRVFPVWPWIQPNRALIRRQPIDDLLATIDIAGELGLDVAVDLLQGHLSSFDFLPSWVITWHRRSIFGDADVLAGLTAYASAVTSAVATRPNVFAITLGNEVNNLFPENPATAEQSRAWAEHLLAATKAAAPGLLTLYSLYDDALYAPDHPFVPADMVQLGDLTTVHSWVFNGVAKVDGPLGPATVSHGDYMVELAASLADDPARPVWLQEVGAPRPEIGDADVVEFVNRTVAHVAANPSTWGVTWWCSHDVDRRFVDFPEREFDLGLFTVGHQRKPVADAFAAAIASIRSGGPGTRQPGGSGLVTRPAIVCPVDVVADPGRRDEVAPGSDFHREWVRHRAQGPVAIVLAGRAGSADYLAARGIGEVLPSAGREALTS